MIQVLAHAKVNLTLEVLGRRPDGYHEVRSIMQSVALHDTLYLRRAERWSVLMQDVAEEVSDNLVLRAGRTLEASLGRLLPTEVRCVKRIPIGAGLGGGSSDAAATLVGLSRLWALDVRRSAAAAHGKQVGSDVAFMVRGGAAKASGRGADVVPLPPLPTHWIVLAVPRLRAETKTATMYAQLTQRHFTSGQHTRVLAEALRQGQPLAANCLYNVFEAVADKVFPGLSALRAALTRTSDLAFHLCGAGPALFALAPDPGTARRSASAISQPNLDVLITRTVRGRPTPRPIRSSVQHG